MMNVKRIISDITLHNYQAAHEYIVNNKLQPICGMDAMRILVKISHTLASVEVSDLYVVKIVRSLEFENLDGKLLSDYLSCIYYVVKYLIDSKHYELVLQLENYLQAAFIWNMQTERLIMATFKCLCNILHSSYIDICKNFKEYKSDFIFKYVTMLTEMTVRGLDNFPVRIEHYLSLLFYMQFDFGKIENFYFNFYELIKCEELKENKENFKGLFIMMSKMCNYYAKKDEFELVQDLINKSLHKLLQYAGNEASVIKKCFNISKLFTPLDKYTEDSHAIMEDFLVNLHTADKFFIHLLAPFVIQILNESLKSKVHWNDIITIPFVKTYFNLATTLAEIVNKLPFTCCCDGNSDLSATFKVTLMKSRLIKCVVSAGRSKEIINDDLHKLSLKSFNDCYECLKIMEKNKCNMYESYVQLLCTMLYKISVKLYHSKDKICLMYFALFTKYSLNIEYTEGTELREDISNCTLFLMADVYIREHQYYNGLKVSALNIFLYPNNSKFSIQQWMLCKKFLGFKYRSMSIVCVLNNNIDYFKELDNNFEKITDCAVIVNLLLIELNALLNKQWPDITYGLLCELNFHADRRTVAKAVVSMNFSDILKLDRNIVIDIIKPCLEYLENIEQKDPESNITLGCLYFLCFKFSVLELKEKNKEVSEPPDIVNECDMTHTYEYLQVFTYNKIYPYLNKSLQSLTEGITSDQLDLSTIHNEIIEVTQELAYEFKLHCNLNNALSALLITLKLVKAINNAELLITISAAIVEHLDVDSKQYIDLTKECDEIIKCSNALKHTILCKYYSSVCFANLRCGRLDQCKEMYEIASEHYKFEDEMTDMAVNAVKLHYIYLQMRLAHLSCSESIHNHKSLDIFRQYTAYKIIFGWVKSTRKLSLEFLSLSMDVLEEILHFYVWERLPREVRCFGKQAIVLAQELLLPFRTVRFIIYLVRADLLSCRFDECEVKLEKLSNILQLTKYKSMHHDLSELSEKIQALSLESPSMVRMVSTNSPILYREKFRLPEFVLHDSHCKCFPCSNLEYKDLVIQKIHMDALLHEVHENSIGALECYSGISTILKKVDKNQCQEHNCLLLNFKYFNSTHNVFMTDFIKYYMKEGNYEMANKLIVKLIKKVNNETNKNYHLYNEVLKMYAALLGDFKEVINVNSNDVQYCILGEPKTSERRISKVNVKQLCHLILSPRQNHIEKPCNLKSNTRYAVDFKIYTPECTKPSMKKSTISAKRTVQKKLSVLEIKNAPMSTKNAARMKMLTEKLKNSNSGSVTRGATRRNVKRLQKDDNDLKSLQSVGRNLLDGVEVNKTGKPTETEGTDFLDLEPRSIDKRDSKSVRQNLSVKNNTQGQRNKGKQKQLDGNNVRKSARTNKKTPKNSGKKTRSLSDEREGTKTAENDTKILTTELLDIEPLVGAQRKCRTRQSASNKLTGFESHKTKENNTDQTSQTVKTTQLKKTKEIPLQEKKDENESNGALRRSARKKTDSTLIHNRHFY